MSNIKAWAITTMRKSKKLSKDILANHSDNCLDDVVEKVYTRDIVCCD